MTTQLEQARKGVITEAMRQAAAFEGISPETVMAGVAEGSVVIPKNIHHEFSARAIGNQMSTKVNANIGTSPSHHNLDEELEKLDIAVNAGADAAMDLSTGGPLDAILSRIIGHSQVMIGTVPIYKAVSRVLAEGRKCAEMTEEELFAEIENQAERGVDFITVHCGITRHSLEI
ncbi:MAG TPA: phosphomethylpyrimidine synthase ThiC, partial [Desulfosalsimonadaceae bacterium]|nr:phosphomethylpyrimidine synthase ThiC [Desulfosalsimonadaceae bacterium]